MSKKLFIYILLSILCMITIFTFSSKNTTESNGTSKGLIKYSINTYEKVFDKDINEEKVISKINYPVRKLAHYIIYLLLGIFIYNIFLLTGVKHKVLISILICMIYAITDETHQLFVSGRTGQVLDVFIDTIGSLTSILLIKFKKNNKYKYYKCRNEKCTYCKDKQTFRSDEDGIVITAGGKSKGGKSKKLDCVDCKCRGKECVAKNGTFITKGGIKMQRYRCARCRKYFTLDENGKVVKKVDRKNEYVECKRQKCKKYEKCAMPNGVPYTRIKDGKQIQRYFCTKCKTYFTQPINKNAEKQAGIETQPN